MDDSFRNLFNLMDTNMRKLLQIYGNYNKKKFFIFHASILNVNLVYAKSRGLKVQIVVKKEDPIDQNFLSSGTMGVIIPKGKYYLGG
jgi:hypothetical protein